MPSLEFHCLNECVHYSFSRCLFKEIKHLVVFQMRLEGKFSSEKKRILICLGMSLPLEVKPQLVSNGISVTHFLLVDFIKVEKP